MRVTPEHLEILRAAIVPQDSEYWRDRYRRRDFHRADEVKDLDKRYRWDLYYAAVREGHTLPDSTDNYNMNHIDTALRAIVPPLGSETK